MTLSRQPPFSIRRKLTLAAVTPLVFILLLVSIAAFNLINAGIVGVAQKKVRNDLNTARAVLEYEKIRVADIIRLTANVSDLGEHLAERLAADSLVPLAGELAATRRMEDLDILILTDRHGRILLPHPQGNDAPPLPFVRRVLAGEHYSGAVLLEPQQLQLEGDGLVRRAAILAPAKPGVVPTILEDRGMFLVGASPVVDHKGRVVGCLYGGILLNNNMPLVDRIKEIVYGSKSADAGGTGSATIFLKDLRAATTISLGSGERAIGTRVSPEVAQAVLNQKQTWHDRARVVDQWYLTAYEPILNSSGEAIGALYVGLLEQPFTALKVRSGLLLLGLLLLGCGFGYLIARSISKALCRPVLELDSMAMRVAEGERNIEITATTRDEIGHLTTTFNRMANALQEREGELNQLNSELEGKVAKRTELLAKKSLELIETQQELLRSEKLAAIGSLAAGVAHEINNPTAIIRGNVEILMMDQPASHPGREEAEEILKQTERISMITQNMLTFAREQSFKFDNVQINGLLADILGQISHQVELGAVEVITDLAPDLPAIFSDGPRLRQVLTNIIINGLQAMKGNGRLTVRSRYDEQEIRLTTADDGPGMDATTREKIFNPFFTTRHQGTGLGLSVSYGIVQALGGKITVESSPGDGATFTVHIPREPPHFSGN